MKKSFKNCKGITLIALVITIVVLIILTTVSINVLVGNSGIIELASSSKSKYKMQEVLEKIKIIKLDWDIKHLVNQNVTEEKFFEALENENITSDINKKDTIIENNCEETEYEVKTKEGYLVEIIVKKTDDKIEIIINGINDGKGITDVEPVPDETLPQEAEIQFSTTVTEVNKAIKTTVVLKDNESGINARKSKWILNQISTKIGVNEENYTNTFASDNDVIDVTPTASGSWYLHVLSVDKSGNKLETVKGTIKTEIGAANYTRVQNKTQVTGTHKSDNTVITREVGDNFNYDCKVSTYTGEWRILGAENGQLLIMSAENITDVELSGKDDYINGEDKLNQICAPYGENARSVKIEDINRVTGYDPNKTGNGQKFSLGKVEEYGNQVTYTASGSSGTNGFKYTGSLKEGKYEHPDGRIIGTGGNTDKITVTNNGYYYYPITLSVSSSTTGSGVASSSKAYKMLFRNPTNTANISYWVASNFFYVYSDYTYWGMRFVNPSAIVGGNPLWYSYGTINTVASGVRAVVTL